VLTPWQVQTETLEDVQQHNTILDIAHQAEKLASALLQENAGRLSEPEIQAILAEELETLLKKCSINLLIGMPGMYEIYSDGILWLMANRV
jgi:hypothetical protein